MNTIGNYQKSKSMFLCGKNRIKNILKRQKYEYKK